MLRHAPQQETQVQISIHHSVSFLSGAVHLIHSFLMNQHHSEDHAPYTRIRGVARLSSEINGCNDVEACIEGHDRGVKVLHWAPLCTNKSTPCCHSCRVSLNVYSRLQVISVSRFNKATEQIPKTVQSGDLGSLKAVDTKYAGGNCASLMYTTLSWQHQQPLFRCNICGSYRFRTFLSRLFRIDSIIYRWARPTNEMQLECTQ